jgi:SAM-dependent methyltransferase
MTYAKKALMNKSKTEKTPTPYDVESKVESFHWWFVGRRRLLKFLLSSINIPKNHLIIDAGCGTGSNLRALASWGYNVIGLDRSHHALSLVRTKGNFPLLSGDLNQLPIKMKSVGIIIALDILEHLENDENGIREIYHTLTKAGALILTVPAFNSLWGIQDIVTGHKRRYSKEGITSKLTKAGFIVLDSSYFNFFLFFPILIARRMIRLIGLKIKSENNINSPLINFFLKIIFSSELYILKYFAFPFGVSIYCVAIKNERI